MLNKKILLISYGIGGTEIMIELYPYLSNTFKDVQFITITDFAYKKAAQSMYINECEILDYILKEKPDIVINERSNGLDIQNRITDHCKASDIFNIAILDVGEAYLERFTSIPDIILSPSYTITEEMKQAGLEGKIITTGNPAFDRLEKYRYTKDINTISPRIVFVSQPLYENNYKESQYEIFERFYKELQTVYKNIDIVIDVKLHPNECIDYWNQHIYKYKNINILNWPLPYDFLQNILEYDLVVGYNSTIQLQTSLIGVPTIFYNIDNALDSLRRFKNKDSLIQNNKYLDFKHNATQNVVNQILNM